MNMSEKKSEEINRILSAIYHYNTGKNSAETLRQIIKISLEEMYKLGIETGKKKAEKAL